jgi:type I restriction enzyme S subunit
MEKQQSKKPLVRFPEFKDAWEHKRLNELLSEAKKRNEDLKYGKDEVLSVSGELGIVNQIEHLGRSYAGVSVHNYHVVEVGDIVYTKSPLKANPFGIIKLNKGKAGIVSTLYAVYKVNQQTAYGPFIDYYFSLDANTNRYLRPLVKKGAKNDMKINNAYVLHDRIFAPDIPEQKRIASFFTVLDKKIDELKQKKTLLEQYKKGVMQKLFSQEMRFKDENGKEFPKWEKKILSDLVKIMYGKDQKNVADENGIYPILGTGGIMGKTNLFLYDKPSVLIGRKGTIDKPVYMDTPFWTVDTLFYTEVFSNTFPSWLFYKFQTINWYLYNEASGVPSLSGSTIYKIKIETPCYSEQIKIAEFLNAIEDKINRTENQLQQTQQYKKGLLQNMFI